MQTYSAEHTTGKEHHRTRSTSQTPEHGPCSLGRGCGTLSHAPNAEQSSFQNVLGISGATDRPVSVHLAVGAAEQASTARSLVQDTLLHKNQMPISACVRARRGVVGRGGVGRGGPAAGALPARRARLRSLPARGARVRSLQAPRCRAWRESPAAHALGGWGGCSGQKVGRCVSPLQRGECCIYGPGDASEKSHRRWPHA